MRLLLLLEDGADQVDTAELFGLFPSGVSIVEQEREEGVGQTFLLKADPDSVAATKLGQMHRLFETACIEPAPGGESSDDTEDE